MDSEHAAGRNIAIFALVCLLATIIAMFACGDGEKTKMTSDAVEWGYDGPGGPENWGSLTEEYAACAIGKQQSPVDITGYVESDAGPLSFSYGTDADKVRNDGKAVHFDYAPGNTMSIGQWTLTLISAHMHSPSEHLLDGVSFAAELHMIHQDADGNLAVVGQFFALGEPSPAVQAILDAAPATGETDADGVRLNAGDYAPRESSYFRYDGSKTTPPCDEPVDWYVMREPKTISQEQVDGLLALSGGPSNRPVQPIGDRMIFASAAP